VKVFRRMLKLMPAFGGWEMEKDIKADNPINFVGGYEHNL